MGLDMYLVRKKYIGAYYEHRKITGNVSIKMGDKEIPIDFNKISYIDEQVAYWRKANAIHNWFVENVQNGNDDCKDYWLGTDKLEELLDLCKEVKKVVIIKEGKYIENKEEIEKLLPTKDGFFFGSTDYDEYYMEDIDYTIKKLEEILKEEKELNKKGFYSDFVYNSSW